MRGAPQLGFSATMRKIRARTSLLTCFRPPTCLALETHVQYKRNPARCQLTTVLGVTKTRGSVRPDQNVLNATQNNLCRAVNRRRGRLACRVAIADGARGFRGQGPPGIAKSFTLQVYDVLARHNGKSLVHPSWNKAHRECATLNPPPIVHRVTLACDTRHTLLFDFE